VRVIRQSLRGSRCEWATDRIKSVWRSSGGQEIEEQRIRESRCEKAEEKDVL